MASTIRHCGVPFLIDQNRFRIGFKYFICGKAYNLAAVFAAVLDLAFVFICRVTFIKYDDYNHQYDNSGEPHNRDCGGGYAEYKHG